jgi:hypothetical protein
MHAIDCMNKMTWVPARVGLTGWHGRRVDVIATWYYFTLPETSASR